MHCIIGLQSQIIDSTNAFDQADITIREPVFVELPRDLNSDGGQYDVVIVSNKTYMVKPKPHAYGMKSCEIVC